MSDGKREFKGVWFPAEVWLDERLTALDKIILIEIDSLDGKDGCYASNEYLAKFCQCSQAKVSGAVSKLKKLGYIWVESFDGRKRVLRSSLKVVTRQTSNFYEAECEKVEERILDESASKECKKETETFDSIIDGFAGSDVLRESLREFLKYRRAAKKPLTNRGLKMNLTKLRQLADNESEMAAIIDQTIMNGWSGLFPLKDGKRRESGVKWDAELRELADGL